MFALLVQHLYGRLLVQQTKQDSQSDCMMTPLWTAVYLDSSGAAYSRLVVQQTQGRQHNCITLRWSLHCTFALLVQHTYSKVQQTQGRQYKCLTTALVTAVYASLFCLKKSRKPYGLLILNLYRSPGFSCKPATGSSEIRMARSPKTSRAMVSLANTPF